MVTVLPPLLPLLLPALPPFIPALVLRLHDGGPLEWARPGSGFRPRHGGMGPVVAPVAVVALGSVQQGRWDAMGLDDVEVSPGRAGTVPAVGAPAPVPTPVEEDLLVEVLHDLDSGLHHHEAGGDGQTEIDVDAHLGPGGGRTQEEEGRQGKGVIESRHLRILLGTPA